MSSFNIIPNEVTYGTIIVSFARSVRFITKSPFVTFTTDGSDECDTILQAHAGLQHSSLC